MGKFKQALFFILVLASVAFQAADSRVREVQEISGNLWGPNSPPIDVEAIVYISTELRPEECDTVVINLAPKTSEFDDWYEYASETQNFNCQSFLIYWDEHYLMEDDKNKDEILDKRDTAGRVLTGALSSVGRRDLAKWLRDYMKGKRHEEAVAMDKEIQSHKDPYWTNKKVTYDVEDNSHWNMTLLLIFGIVGFTICVSVCLFVKYCSCLSERQKKDLQLQIHETEQDQDTDLNVPKSKENIKKSSKSRSNVRFAKSYGKEIV